MNRSKILVLVMLLVVSVSLGACGKKESKDGKVEVSYAIWDKDQEVVYQKIIEEFEKENPEIKIKLEVTPWDQYWTKLETAVTGGNAPDVFWMNTPNAQNYIDSGILAELENPQYDEAKFAEQYIKTFSKDNKLYGIPKDFDTQALYYNKAIFDEAGIEYPDESWDWAKWKEVAKKLTNEEEGIYGMLAPVFWQGGYYEMIYENGGSPFSEDGKKSLFDQKEVIEALEFYHSFMEEGTAPPIEVQASGSNYELMLSGKMAMTVGGSYGVPTYFTDEYGLENIDIAPIPKGKTRAVTSNSVAHVMYSRTKNPKEAQKWIEFLSSEKGMTIAGDSGLVLPVYAGSETGWVNAHPDKNLQVFVDAKEYAVPLPNFKNSMAAISVEQDILNDAWTGKLTIEEACNEIAKKANEVLAKD